MKTQVTLTFIYFLIGKILFKFYFKGAVAEFTIGFLLNISRKISQGMKEYFSKRPIDSLYWFAGTCKKTYLFLLVRK